MSLKIIIQYNSPMFEVRIVNLADKPIRLWAMTYLAGYNSIHFKITNQDNGDEVMIGRKPIRWTVNVPDFYLVDAGGYKDLELNINDGTWDLSGIRDENQENVDISILFDVKAEK